MKTLDLSNIKKLKNATHWTAEINQLYHPTGVFGQDSQDTVYSFANINTTKFAPILLKEWFYLLKKDGYLVIDYIPNKLCDFKILEKNMWLLWRGKYEIIYHGTAASKDLQNLEEKKLKDFIKKQENHYEEDTINKNAKGRHLRFICKKKVATKISGDDIDKWTFGIITNGKRRDWMEQIIQSIKKQKIKNYEIIVCGTYYDRKEENFKYIPFNKRDDVGWITKKKNFIVENSAYENICIIHDRLVLDKKWYQGMKKWGNCFEIMSCVQMYKGVRLIDWVVAHFKIKRKNQDDFYITSYLDFKDWYNDAWILGQLNIFKKSIMVKNNLWYDETRFWMDKEDYYLSENFNREGFIHRFNPNSLVESLHFSYLKSSSIKFSKTSEVPRFRFNNIYPFLKICIYLLTKVFYSLPFKSKNINIEKLRASLYKLIFK